MKEIATIRFKDVETGNDAVAIVRRNENLVAICLSVQGGADVEVGMSMVDATALLAALRVATA
jgi:hypothetical protein